MIVFVGASASGKTELAKILFNSYGYNKCITTTTRMMRSNERQDIDYHFISAQAFLDKQAHGDFIEVTYYQENLYGIQKKDVNINGVVIVDPAGANALIEQMNKKVYVVYVETSESLRKSRMINRGDELVAIDNRLISDFLVFQPHNIERINLYLKNEDNCLAELAKIIHEAYQAYLLST